MGIKTWDLQDDPAPVSAEDTELHGEKQRADQNMSEMDDGSQALANERLGK